MVATGPPAACGPRPAATASVGLTCYPPLIIGRRRLRWSRV